MALLARRRPSAHRFVLVVVAAVAGLRLLEIPGPLHPDEAGLLMVARSWGLGGPELYGHYFVDRPPLLLLLYRLAAMTGWDRAIRLLVVPFAVLLVVAAAWAAWQLAGDAGARWAAVVAGALAVTPVLDVQEADAEVFAAPLVMLSVALTIWAVRRAARRAGSTGSTALVALAAGVVAGAAMMVKQNFVDGVVFAVVLLVASTAQRLVRPRPAALLAMAGGSGVLAVLLSFLGYAAWSGGGVREGWFTLFSFRGLAFDVIEDHGFPVQRATTLVLLAVVSGLLPLLSTLVPRAWRTQLTGPPVAWAVGVTLVVELVGIAGGGSYWPHYLVQLAPMAALLAGLWGPQLAWVRVAAALCVGSAAVGLAMFAVNGPTGRSGLAVGEVLRSSSVRGDTATVLYGNAQVQEASGMPSPYPQLWTLPMRALDPHLRRLGQVLRHDRAPTWLVEWLPLDSWGIDRTDRIQLLIATHYRPVGTVCGHRVWLHDGVRRRLAGSPPRC